MLCAWSVAAGAGEGSRRGNHGEKVWYAIWVGEGPQKRKEAQLELKEVEGRSQRCVIPMGKEKEGSCGGWNSDVFVLGWDFCAECASDTP